jgi:hypothetical protein
MAVIEQFLPLPFRITGAARATRVIAVGCGWERLPAATQLS